MATINLFDSWNLKFAKPIKEHWEAKGHIVNLNPKWEDVPPADINFFYQADNTAIEGVNKHDLVGKTYVQCVDIEVWAGQANAVNWNKVNGGIFMAKHIRNMVNTATCVTKIIVPGIDLNKFTLKKDLQNHTPVRRIAYVVGDNRIWDVKRFDIAMQLLKDLMNTGQLIWQLHVRGTYSTHAQYNAYCKYLESDLELNNFLFWHDKVDDMNAWLEDKDFFLLPSTKEVFSYATAEAMAKGIKPIINNWQSSKDNWRPFVCDTQGQMLFEFLRGENEPEKYRQYVVEHFDQERYFKELDEFMGIV